ncbi:MAG TPA: nickel pincer cofactor biosynthesis protein LarB [Deltaproteobacteria bacterium]|nr:nickel pincer cofactor biosynthesis protein LarB [Deltaproteobacteria bacterium]
MNVDELKKMLTELRQGRIDVDAAVERLRVLPFEELEHATIDTHRSLRQGFPEVVFGEGKTAAQIEAIAAAMTGRGENVLVTRVDYDKGATLVKRLEKARYDALSRTLFIETRPVEERGKGTVLVLCAGTSDVPVAEEAALTATYMGNRVERLYDVGVAGIHRLLHKKDAVMGANVLVVVAGMEGALPSVVAGLVSRPVVAVPTSVGYGANLGGLTTLLAMLNSCASGVSVVNIDNGFGAAYVASLINR